MNIPESKLKSLAIAWAITFSLMSCISCAGYTLPYEQSWRLFAAAFVIGLIGAAVMIAIYKGKTPDISSYVSKKAEEYQRIREKYYKEDENGNEQ